MPLSVVGLVLASCLLHALWNLLLKRARDKSAFTALYLTASAVVYLPLFLWLLPSHPMPLAGWMCAAATGAVYCGYFLGTARAYQQGDLSTVYPLMRGLGPVLAVLGGVFVLGERPGPLTLAGGFLVLVGSGVLNEQQDAVSTNTAPRRVWATPATVAAVFVAITYGLYSLIDKVAVGPLHVDPPSYLYITYLLSTVVVVPVVFVSRGRAAVAAEWRANGASCVAVGVLGVLSYLLILYAMAMPGAQVSSLVPLRTLSVPIGVLLGGWVLGEKRLAIKLAASAAVITGVTLIAWGGS